MIFECHLAWVFVKIKDNNVSLMTQTPVVGSFVNDSRCVRHVSGCLNLRASSNTQSVPLTHEHATPCSWHTNILFVSLQKNQSLQILHLTVHGRKQGMEFRQVETLGTGKSIKLFVLHYDYLMWALAPNLCRFAIWGTADSCFCNGVKKFFMQYKVEWSWTYTKHLFSKNSLLLGSSINC